ncbi:MAG: nucleotidyltransferase family protein [Paracoccaceae bacterium]
MEYRSIENATLHLKHTILDAIHSLEKSSLKIVLVMSEDGSLLGSVTDGDIRRALLKGLDLSNPVTSIMNEEPITGRSHQSSSDIQQIISEHEVERLPILDQDSRVIGVASPGSISQRNLGRCRVIIMAGGFGKRLQHLTRSCPKPMLEVGGKPMLESLIIGLKDQGLRNFTITTHFLGNIIKDYFQDGSDLGVQIEYFDETEPLGTGGAIFELEHNKSDPVFVVNADVRTPLKFGSFLSWHNLNGADASVAVVNQQVQIPYGVVQQSDNNYLGIEEKPVISHLVNTGIYILNPKSLPKVETQVKIDMPEILDLMCKDNRKVCVFPIWEEWVDMGVPQTLQSAQRQEDQKIK